MSSTCSSLGLVNGWCAAPQRFSSSMYSYAGKSTTLHALLVELRRIVHADVGESLRAVDGDERREVIELLAGEQRVAAGHAEPRDAAVLELRRALEHLE